MSESLKLLGTMEMCYPGVRLGFTAVLGFHSLGKWYLEVFGASVSHPLQHMSVPNTCQRDRTFIIMEPKVMDRMS